MYHRVRKKMIYLSSAILILSCPLLLHSRSIETTSTGPSAEDDVFENNIIDFDEEYTVKFNKKYGMVPWHANDNDYKKNSHRYTIVRNDHKQKSNESNVDNVLKQDRNKTSASEDTTTEDFRVIPLELLSTTEDPLITLVESTTEQDLTVIPLSTTEKILNVQISETNVTLPSTENAVTEFEVTTENADASPVTETGGTSTLKPYTPKPDHDVFNITTSKNSTLEPVKTKLDKINETALNSTRKKTDTHKLHGTKNQTISIKTYFESKEEDVPIFTELDTENGEDIPEDYYDSKDVVPTSVPNTNAISVLFSLAGSVVESVVESVAERVVPKSIFDIFKRMQKQSEALEAERLRSREENGGLGQFGRGILKSISTGLSQPLTKLMESKENGSLDTDRGFVSSVANGVSSVADVANSVVDAFKDKVQAIYPGTVWCGDGHAATARSGSELGLFFLTDTCCRQHDACKIYIKAGATKYGLTNTGLFTRSHCSCDRKFRECLQRTNSLVSGQIGLTYFNVLGPQCFRRAHPIVKCLRKTRITGFKCEEYELDYSKPPMWQWFDNETF